jgi:hypothetical protein
VVEVVSTLPSTLIPGMVTIWTVGGSLSEELTKQQNTLHFTFAVLFVCLFFQLFSFQFKTLLSHAPWQDADPTKTIKRIILSYMFIQTDN